MGSPLERDDVSSVPGSVTSDVLSQVDRTGESTVAVWRPDPHVSFGPRDRNQSAYQQAAGAARSRGFAVFERNMGGRPVAMHEDCVAIVYGTTGGETIEERYHVVVEAVQSVLTSRDVSVERGELSASFCPGQHSLLADGKVAGFAQRVRGDAAAVGGLVIVRNRSALIDVLEPVYDVLELPFDPDTVGSVARAGFVGSTTDLRAELEDRLLHLATSGR